MNRQGEIGISTFALGTAQLQAPTKRRHSRNLSGCFKIRQEDYVRLTP